MNDVFMKMAPEVGLEPTTDRLTADCSTNWAIQEYNQQLSILPGRFQPSTFDV